MDIKPMSIFVNKDGNTVKIEDVNIVNKVTYIVNGSSESKSARYEVVEKMLELGGYKDITQTISGFFVPKNPTIASPKVGDKIQSDKKWKYEAEVIKIDNRGIHVQFSVRCASPIAGAASVGFGPVVTTYIYDEKDFRLVDIFTSELISELDLKCSRNVFEVIATNAKDEEIKFTVMGQSVNKELLDKINAVYTGLSVYSIKRLTAINIQ